MAYTARKLITKSYYLTGITSRDLQTVTGEQINDGLDLLNEILAVKSVNQELIPYFSEYNLVAVKGQEKYFIPNLIELETLTFNIQQVRFPMYRLNRGKYWGTGRADNIQSLPFQYEVERVRDGSNIYMYFIPYENYPLRLWGKFGVTSITSLDQDLSASYDTFYLAYLRYALAEYICADYNLTFQPQSAQKLRELETQLKNISPYDLTITKLSTLGQKDLPVNYGYANLGSGWEP